jgi:hypothetical protein
MDNLDPQNSEIEEVIQWNMDRIKKLDSAPKLNPRLRVIREEEMKFSNG